MLKQVTQADFIQHVNTRFSITGSTPAPLALELCQVSELRASPRQESYSLVFKGPGDLLLPQQIYHLEHEQLGALDIFLVPIERDGESIYYEAVFNRLIPRERGAF